MTNLQNDAPDFIKQLVEDNAAVIAWAAAEGYRGGDDHPVVMLVDLDEAEKGDRKVIEFFSARIFGRVAAAPISLRHARGLIRAASAATDALLARLRIAPPHGYVHTLVLSRAFGGIGLTYGRATTRAAYLA